MPRRSILSAAERDGLLAIPEAQDELIRLYTFSDADLALIGQILTLRWQKSHRLSRPCPTCTRNFSRACSLGQ